MDIESGPGKERGSIPTDKSNPVLRDKYLPIIITTLRVNRKGVVDTDLEMSQCT